MLGVFVGAAAPRLGSPAALRGHGFGKKERGRLAGRKRLRLAIGAELGRLRKTHAVLIAVQFAANHEAEFGVADALAVVVALIGESLAGLDRLDAAS